MSFAVVNAIVCTSLNFHLGERRTSLSGRPTSLSHCGRPTSLSENLTLRPYGGPQTSGGQSATFRGPDGTGASAGTFPTPVDRSCPALLRSFGRHRAEPRPAIGAVRLCSDLLVCSFAQFFSRRRGPVSDFEGNGQMGKRRAFGDRGQDLHSTFIVVLRRSAIAEQRGTGCAELCGRVASCVRSECQILMLE